MAKNLTEVSCRWGILGHFFFRRWWAKINIWVLWWIIVTISIWFIQGWTVFSLSWHFYLFWGDLTLRRDNPVVPLCLSNFPVPLSVTSLRRFYPSSQPLIKFAVSSQDTSSQNTSSRGYSSRRYLSKVLFQVLSEKEQIDI